MNPDIQASGSLRKRLGVTLITGAAIVAVGLFFVVRTYATTVAQQGQDNILGASVGAILDAATVRNGVVEIDIPYSAFSMLNTPSDDKVFYAIYHEDAFLSGYPNLPGRGGTPPDERRYQTTTYQEDTVRLVSASRTLIGLGQRTQLNVTLAQTQDQLSETLQQISRTAAWLGFGFFALVAALSFLATSSTIGQLERLTASVTRRGPQDLSPFRKPVPTEMQPLVTSLNSLMGRLDQSLSQSEDFIAEAAHRVRTPLATVRSYAEATLQRVDKEENRKAMRSMIRAIDESSRAAGQLLDHAMITFRADHLERQDIDLVALLNEQLMRLSPIAEMKDVDLQLTGDAQIKYSGDPILIQNAVRNLIDNALKYSPPEHSVVLHATADPRPQISVCDNGAGFPAEELDSLDARFKRGRNAEGTIGSGLGLTIAKDVALAHGGDLVLSNQSSGGACATLLL